MNDEIKEVLEHLSATQKINNGWTSFSVEECKMLYDYITNLKSKIEAYELFDNQKIANLQQENERLIEQLENISLEEANIRADILLEQQDYKSRNEKAIEHLKEIMKDEEEYEEDYIYNKYLLDILQGSDKE